MVAWQRLVLTYICFEFFELALLDGGYPRNVAVPLGTRVHMNCAVSGQTNNAAWKYVSSASSVTYNISNGRNATSARYELITSEPHQYDLVIKESEEEDAGNYLCLDENRTGVTTRRSAQVVIMVSEPRCGLNVSNLNVSMKEGDNVSMWCVAQFRGHVAPLMEWRHGINGRVIPSQVTVVPNFKVSSNIALQVSYCDNEARYSCTVNFNDIERVSVSGVVAATGAPEYTYTWMSPALIVSETTARHPAVNGLIAAVVILSVAVLVLGTILTILFLQRTNVRPNEVQ